MRYPLDGANQWQWTVEMKRRFAPYTYIGACAPIIYFCCTRVPTTRVFIYLHICVSAPIFTIAHIRMLIWLSCYYCYYMIRYTLWAQHTTVGTRYTMYCYANRVTENHARVCSIRVWATIIAPEKISSSDFSNLILFSRFSAACIIVISLSLSLSFLMISHYKTFFLNLHNNLFVCTYNNNTQYSNMSN